MSVSAVGLLRSSIIIVSSLIAEISDIIDDQAVSVSTSTTTSCRQQNAKAEFDFDGD